MTRGTIDDGSHDVVTLYVGLHTTKTSTRLGREVSDVNYRRSASIFEEYGSGRVTNQLRLAFFKGRATRRHKVVDVGLYASRAGGMPLWVTSIEPATIASQESYHFEPSAILVLLEDWNTIVGEALNAGRPTAWTLLDSFPARIKAPPLLAKAWQPFETIKR
jgi:hypothetical protein